jgi:hypothetical protein
LLKNEGINLLSVPPHTPINLNGTTERVNLDLQQKICCLLIDSGFPKDFWSFALQFAIQIYNKTPKKSIDGKIPYTMFHERPCTIKYLKRFGCQSFVLNNSKLGKFDERTLTGFVINCLDDSYLVIDPMTGNIWRSKNVDCTESVTYGDVFNDSANKSVFSNCHENITFGENIEKEGSSDESCMSPSRLVNDVLNVDANMSELFLDEEPVEILNVEGDPEKFEDAVSGEDSVLWKAAIQDELDSLAKNKTWILVKRSETSPKDVLSSRWVFKTKVESDGSHRKKARLVIRGFED